jgi:hypothetical protein
LEPAAGSCEYGNDFSGSIKGGGVPDQLSDCQVLKKASCLLWNVFTASSFLIRYQSFYYSTLSLGRVEKIGSVAKDRMLWTFESISVLLVELQLRVNLLDLDSGVLSSPSLQIIVSDLEEETTANPHLSG